MYRGFILDWGSIAIPSIVDNTDPNLLWFAIDILPIQTMSAEPGRVGCRRTITWQRMRLGVKVVEEGECLKSWIRSGVVGRGRHPLQRVEFEGNGW